MLQAYQLLRAIQGLEIFVQNIAQQSNVPLKPSTVSLGRRTYTRANSINLQKLSLYLNAGQLLRPFLDEKLQIFILTARDLPLCKRSVIRRWVHNAVQRVAGLQGQILR